MLSLSRNLLSYRVSLQAFIVLISIMHKRPHSGEENSDLQGCDRHSTGVNAMNEQVQADLSSQQGRSSLRGVWPGVPVGPVVYTAAAVGRLWLPCELCWTE